MTSKTTQENVGFTGINHPCNCYANAGNTNHTGTYHSETLTQSCSDCDVSFNPASNDSLNNSSLCQKCDNINFASDTNLAKLKSLDESSASRSSSPIKLSGIDKLRIETEAMVENLFTDPDFIISKRPFYFSILCCALNGKKIDLGSFFRTMVSLSNETRKSKNVLNTYLNSIINKNFINKMNLTLVQHLCDCDDCFYCRISGAELCTLSSLIKDIIILYTHNSNYMISDQTYQVMEKPVPSSNIKHQDSRSNALLLPIYNTDFIKGDSIEVANVNNVFYELFKNETTLIKSYNNISIAGSFVLDDTLAGVLFLYQYGSVSLYVHDGTNPLYCIDDVHIANSYNARVVDTVSLENPTMFDPTVRFKFNIDKLTLDVGQSVRIISYNKTTPAFKLPKIAVSYSYHRYTANVPQVQPFFLSFLKRDIYTNFTQYVAPETVTTMIECDLNKTDCVELKFYCDHKLDLIIARTEQGAVTYDSIVAGPKIRLNSKQSIRIKIPSSSLQTRLVIISHNIPTLLEIRAKLVSSGDVELNPGPVDFDLLWGCYVVDGAGSKTIVMWSTDLEVANLFEEESVNITEVAIDSVDDVSSTRKTGIWKKNFSGSSNRSKGKIDTSLKVDSTNIDDSSIQDRDYISNTAHEAATKTENVIKSSIEAGKNGSDKYKKHKQEKQKEGVDITKKDADQTIMKAGNILADIKIKNKKKDDQFEQDYHDLKLRSPVNQARYRDSAFSLLSTDEKLEVGANSIIKKFRSSELFQPDSSISEGMLLTIWCGLTNYSVKMQRLVVAKMWQDYNVRKANETEDAGDYGYDENFWFQFCSWELEYKTKNFKNSIKDASFEVLDPYEANFIKRNFLKLDKLNKEDTLYLWALAMINMMYDDIKSIPESVVIEEAPKCVKMPNLDMIMNNSGYSEYLKSMWNRLLHAINGNIDSMNMPTVLTSVPASSTYTGITATATQTIMNKLFNSDSFIANDYIGLGVNTGVISRGSMDKGTIGINHTSLFPWTNLSGIQTTFWYNNPAVGSTVLLDLNSPAFSYSTEWKKDMSAIITPIVTTVIASMAGEKASVYGRNNLINNLGYRYIEYANLACTATNLQDAYNSNVLFCYNMWLLFDYIMLAENTKQSGRMFLPRSIYQCISAHCGVLLEDPIIWEAGFGIGVAGMDYSIKISGEDHIVSPGRSSNLFFSNGNMGNAIWPDVTPQYVYLPGWMLDLSTFDQSYIAMYLACITSQPFFPVICSTKQETAEYNVALLGPLHAVDNYYRTLASSIYIGGLDNVCIVIPMFNPTQNDVYANANDPISNVMIRPKLNAAIAGKPPNDNLSLCYRNAVNNVVTPGDDLTIGDYIYSWSNRFTLQKWQIFVNAMCNAFGVTTEMDLAMDLYLTDCYRCRPSVMGTLDNPAAGTPITYSIDPTNCLTFPVDARQNGLLYPSSIVNQQTALSYDEVPYNKRPLPAFNIDIYNGYNVGTLKPASVGRNPMQMLALASPGSWCLTRAMMLSYSSFAYLEKIGYSATDLGNMYTVGTGGLVYAAIKDIMHTDGVFDLSDNYNGFMLDMFGSSLGMYNNKTTYSYNILTQLTNNWHSVYTFGVANATGLRTASTPTLGYCPVYFPVELLRLVLDKDYDCVFTYKNNGCITNGVGIQFAAIDKYDTDLRNATAQPMPTTTLMNFDYISSTPYDVTEYYNLNVLLNMITTQPGKGVPWFMFNRNNTTNQNSVFSGSNSTYNVIFGHNSADISVPNYVTSQQGLNGYCYWTTHKTNSTNSNLRLAFGLGNANTTLYQNLLVNSGDIFISQNIKSIGMSSTQQTLNRKARSCFRNLKTFVGTGQSNSSNEESSSMGESNN